MFTKLQKTVSAILVCCFIFTMLPNSIEAKKKISVKSVKLNVKTITLVKGDKYKLKATIAPKNASNKSVKWTSSNSKVVKVNGSGVITGVKKGNAVVSVVTVDKKKKAVCKVKIIEKILVKSVSLDKSALSMKVGENNSFIANITPKNATDKAVKWKSSNPSVASVSSKGNVSAIKAGTTVISVTTSNNKKATCSVTVAEDAPTTTPTIKPTPTPTPIPTEKPSDFKYVIENNQIVLTGYVGLDDNVIIPPEIKGYSVARISEKAFSGRATLTGFNIPASVTTIDDGAFRGCRNVDEINVDAGNRNFTSVSGVLYNKDKTVLIKLPNFYDQSKYTILDGTTKIGNGAFEDCWYLDRVTFPVSLKTIGKYAFKNSDISFVEIPAHITNIEDNAFENCQSLSRVDVLAGSTVIFGNEVFKGSSHLGYVFLKSGDITFGKGVFYECKELKTIEFTAGITEVPDFMFYGCRDLSTIDVPSTVTKIGISAFEATSSYNMHLSEGLKELGDRAFADSNVREITLPSSLEKIGSCVFFGCDLYKVYVGDESEYFSSINGVLYNKDKTELIAYTGTINASSYIILAGVTKIADGAFAECRNLTSVTLPVELESIGDYAFYNSRLSGEIDLPAGVKSIGDYAFGKTVITSIELSTGLVSIGDFAFNFCEITSINIPSGRIGVRAFDSCYDLVTVNISTNVTEIAEGAFSGCPARNINVDEANPNYSSVNGTLLNKDKTLLIRAAGGNNMDYVILDGVTTIGFEAFYFRGYNSITFSDSVTTIEDYAFNICFINSLTLPSNVTNIGEYAFAESMLTSISLSDGMSEISKGAFKGCNQLTNVTIPNNIIGIGDEAFTDCKVLEVLSLPEGLIEIGEYAFSGCDVLKDLSLPASLTTIGDYAFDRCKAFERIVIPTGVRHINKNTFKGCNLIRVTIPRSVTSIDEGAFYGMGDLYINVYEGSYAETYAKENKYRFLIIKD